MSDTFDPRVTAHESRITELERTSASLQQSAAIKDEKLKHLEERQVEHGDVVKMLEPIRDTQVLQGIALQKLGDSQKDLTDTVKGVLKTYNDNMVASTNAELAKAKAWGVGNVFKVSAIIMGGITTITGGLVVIYAAFNWWFTHLK